MNILYFFLLVFLLTTTGFSQILRKTDVYSFSFHQINDLTIKLNNSDIRLERPDEVVFSKTIVGKKIIKHSPSKEHFFITNFAFNNSMNSFPVETFVYNSEGELTGEYKTTAYYDVPHDLFAINNEGTLLSYNPSNYSLTIYKNNDLRNITLKRDAAFEYERSAFIGTIGGNYFVITSDKPVDISDNSNDVTTYLITPDLSVTTKEMAFTIPTAVYSDEEILLISGVKFENSMPKAELLHLDRSLNIIKSAPVAAEKIISVNDFYFLKSGNSLLKLNRNLEVVGSTSFENRWIKDITAGENIVAAYSGDASTNYISSFTHNLDKVSEGKVESNAGEVFNGIEEIMGGIIIKFDNHTYLYK